MYQQQRQQCTEVWAVPYAMLTEAVEQLAGNNTDWMRNTIFLHSTGRCGSTLLCKLLGQGRGVVSLSEPDIYSYFTWVVSRQFDESDQLAAPALLRSITWLLYRLACPAGNNTGIMCIKLRGQVMWQAETLKQAMPTSKSIFLYRDPIDTIDSFCAAFLSGFVNRQLRWWNLDSWFIYKVSGWEVDFPYLAPLLASGDSRFPDTLVRKLGFVGFITMIWLSTMDVALRLQRTSFFDAVIRYEDLCTNRVTVADALMNACGYNGAGLSATSANAVFDEDAHGSTGTTRSRRREQGSKGPIYITQHDDPLVRELIACHDVLATTDGIIPGTMTFV